METNELLHRIIDKLAKLDDRADRIDVTLAGQHESLKEHIRRTNALEEQLKPVQKHVAMAEGAVKLIGMLGITVGIIEGIISLISKV